MWPIHDERNGVVPSLKTIADWSAFVCAPHTTIREVIRRIDASTPLLFQIVIDEQNHVIGTVTDGDVRRGFARGLQLEDSVAACMHTPPVVARTGDVNLAALLQGRRFLPVCDSHGGLQHLLVESWGPRRVEQAMVMSGGLGTRLGARTRKTPKPLVEVAGTPLLEHVLRRLEAYQIERVYISVHYLAEQIRRFVGERDNQCEVIVVEEEVPLGTAGSLGLIDWPTSVPGLTMNADVLTEIDLNALVEHHLRMGCAGTVAAARYQYEVPYGVLRFDDHDILHGIDEKPSFYHLVSAGIYYLDPSVIALMPEGKRFDMPELLQSAVRHGLRLSVFPVHEYWSDVGRPADLEQADIRHAVRHDGDAGER